jgi:Domain of unknown function DUF11
MRAPFTLLIALTAVLAGTGPAAAAGPAALISISHAPDPVTSGHFVGYTTSFTNQSKNTLTHLALSVPPPSGGAAVLGLPSSACAVKGSSVVCAFGSIPSGATMTATVILRAPAATAPFATTATWSVDESFNDTPKPDPHRDTFTATDMTHVQAPSQDAVSEYVLPSGDTLTTNPGAGATRTNPQVTTVHVPQTPLGVPALAAEVDATGATDSCGPAADCFGQVSLVTVDAPPFPVGGPLKLIFDIDSSEIPAGMKTADIPMYHDGVLVPDCTGAAGVASPDPCVSSRTGKKDAEVTVLSSTNGRWRP